jgi:hypothetical protein
MKSEKKGRKEKRGKREKRQKQKNKIAVLFAGAPQFAFNSVHFIPGTVLPH